MLGSLRKQPRVSTPVAKPTTPTWWSQTKVPPPHSRKFLISSISFLSMHVWSWFVGYSRPSPPSPQGQPARVLSWRTLFSSWPNMARTRSERAKPLRLACWNADGVRGRKLEMEHFLNQHGVDICLLTFIVRAHLAWCSHLKWAWAERIRAGGLRPFKFSVHSRRGLELYPHSLSPHSFSSDSRSGHFIKLCTYAPH